MDLLVFDIDDTLTKTAKIYQDVFTAGLKELGIDKENHQFQNFKHHTDSYIAKEIFEESLNKEFDHLQLNELENIIIEKTKGIPIVEVEGARKAIKELREKKIGICFATGSFLKPAIYKLNEIGIYFEDKLLVASNNFHSREEIVNQAILNAKTFYKKENFNRIISIGDGIWDLECAKNLGIEFIGIGSRNKAQLIKNGVTTHFNNLTNFSY